MKNQALVTAISGLLIGGFGIANKVEILKIAGTGLLFSSATVIVTSKQNKTQPKSENTANTSESSTSAQSNIVNTTIEKPIPKNKSIEKPIKKSLPKNKSKSIEKPILQVK
ncbi:hypothetical protein ACN4EE_23035 [Geminocystis sp. CENA526]|uniref:hypothetical protein n=1 Tax=Geminocystis sp. CENA526 TaxID=1355871 RepID=UPI003D700CB3